MTPEEAPVGAVASLGHPANLVYAQKADNGRWYYITTSEREVDFDSMHKGARQVS